MIEEVAEPSIRVYLSQEKKLKFKTVCVSQGRGMSDVVNELFVYWGWHHDRLYLQREVRE